MHALAVARKCNNQRGFKGCRITDPLKPKNETLTDMINDYTIQRVKDAASIVEVIGEFYDIRKKGVNYECLCPFHEDRHLGSFVINPRRNTYCCYSCGEHGNAVDFLMKHEGLTFPDAVRWLGSKYGIATDDENRTWVHEPHIATPHKPLPELPTLTLPIELVKAKSDNTGNVLVGWLRSLPWNAEQRDRLEDMIRNYLIGTSRDGRTIFWQMDEKGNVRTGKLMRYKADGHRDKTSPGNFGWIHSMLIRMGAIDEDKEEMRQCLFGLHLLDIAKAKTINIVESEKTALFCAIAYGNMTRQLWMATGGKTQLTRQKLQPLIDRKCHIYLYPDHDGFDEWTQLAESIRYEQLTVEKTLMEKYWRPEDGMKADIADVLLRILTTPNEQERKELQRIDALIEGHPAFEKLVKDLDLIVKYHGRRN